MSKSWIEDLLTEVHKDVETPESYMYWSLLCCISAVAANKYTLRTLKGNVIYYPNIYVMLLGESGLGKGFPVNLAKRLVQETDSTRVIAGRSSIQAIIQELAQTRQTPNKPLILDSRGFIVNGELSTAIIADPDSLTILTDLYDRNYNPQWTNMLKGAGHEKLKEPYITCLFGSSPAHFYDSIPQPNIEGGYIGRNLVIYEEERSKNLDLLDSEDESINEDKFTNVIIPKYLPHLKKISDIKDKVRMIPTEAARNVFNNWRKDWRNTQAQYNDRTGFVNRTPDHALKVAMLLSLARYEGNAVIDEEDITNAIVRVTNLIYANQKASEGGMDILGAQTRRVIDHLIKAPENQLTRQELLIQGYGDFDNLILDKIIETLMEMGWIKRSKTFGRNADWMIKLAGEPLESLMRFRAQNNGSNKK